MCIRDRSYTVSEDDKSIEFVLRDGLKWHDGEPLTAEDVKFTLELMLRTPGTNAVASEVMKAIQGAQDFLDGKTDNLEGVVIDGNKITVNFDTVSANALAVFSQWPILPKHCLENASPETLQQDQFWQKPIGSGPFKVDEVVPVSYTQLDVYKRQVQGKDVLSGDFPDIVPVCFKSDADSVQIMGIIFIRGILPVVAAAAFIPFHHGNEEGAAQVHILVGF